MALVQELESNGCELKASPLCKYIKREVQRCQACEFKAMSKEERKQQVVEYYQSLDLLKEYPIPVSEQGKCALCRKDSREATTQTYAKITNKIMDVKKDLAGSGEKINGGEIELAFPTCQRCQENIRKVHFQRKMMAVLSVIFVVATTGLINVTITPTIQATGTLVPMLVFFACCVAGSGLYYLLTKNSLSFTRKTTHIQALDLPALAEMKKQGWYVRGNNWLKATIYPQMPEDLVETRVTFEQMVRGNKSKSKALVRKGR